MSNITRPLIITATVLLTAVTGLVFYLEVLSSPQRRFTGKLEDAIPRTLAGWEVKDIQLADTAAGRDNVLSVLNYDQVVQRLFIKDGIQVMVYVAYWEPGRVSLVDAGSHNPDSCWVLAGCERTERAYAVPGKVGQRHLLPYEWGEYVTPQGGRIQAMFWHLVNGVPNRYEEQNVGWRVGIAGRIERAELVLKDIRERGLNQKAEQMFVRLSSNKKPEELLADPDTRWLLDQLGKVGIFKDEPWR
jgi:hypothetical protein